MPNRYPLSTDNFNIYFNQGSGEESLAVSGSIDHGLISGLTDDDHSQYFLNAGRSGGQVAVGGIDSGDDLTLQSTSNATKGKIFFGANSVYDEVNDSLGIGQTTPTARTHIEGATSDNSAYALKVDDSSDSSLLSVRNDGVISGKQIRTNFGNSVFLGEGAGLNDDGTTNQNVGVGYASLYSNTEGFRNTAYGYNSLYSNTTGFRNTASGWNSLGSNTEGNYNTAYGYSSLATNTTGQQNTASGFSSLFGNTTGAYNTASGYYSLGSNTEGNSNTAYGNFSLFSNTTGSSNTASGVNSGRYIANGTSPNQTSSNSVYIGTNTKALADGGTNENVFGYNTTGHGSNTVTIGNDSVTNNYFNGEIKTKGSTSDSSAYALKVEDVNDANLLSVRNDGLVSFKNYALPTADGTANQVLKTNGSGSLTWQDDTAGGTPAGADTQIQFNDAGSFGTNANFVWDKTNERLGLGTSTPEFYRLEVIGDTTTADSGSIRARSNVVGSALTDTATITIDKNRDDGNGADYEWIGRTLYVGNSSTGNTYNVAQVSSQAGTVTDGSENGRLFFEVASSGSLVQKLEIYGDEIVANDLLTVKGSGTTSSTYTLKITDSADAKNFFVRDDGQVEFKNYAFPIADGSADQVLKTDGSGTLSFADVPSPTLSIQNLTATGTSQTIDWSSGEIVNLDVSGASGDVTLTLQNPVNGDYIIEVTQGSTARNIIFPAGTKQGNGVSGNTVVGVSNSVQLITVLYKGLYIINVDTIA